MTEFHLKFALIEYFNERQSYGSKKWILINEPISPFKV